MNPTARSFLGLNKTLERVGRLKSVVQDSCNRVAQLERELHQNAARADRQIDRQIKELDDALAREVDEADAQFQSNKKKLESIQNRRKSALLRAHPAARKHRLKLIESREGRQINEVQRELLHTNRCRETDQKQTDKTFADFQQELAREQEALNLLERRTRRVFRGYTAFQRLLETEDKGTCGSIDSPADENRLLDEFRALLARSRRGPLWFRLSPLTFLFSLLPPWHLVVLSLAGHLAAFFALPHFAKLTVSWPQVAVSFAAVVGAIFVLHFLGRIMAARGAKKLATALGRARALLGACGKAAEVRYQHDHERIRQEAERRTEFLHQRWYHAVEEAEDMRKSHARRLEQKLMRALERNDQFTRRGIDRLQAERDERVKFLETKTAAERDRLEESRAATKKRIESEQHSQWAALHAEWQAVTRSAYDAFDVARAQSERLFPPWTAPHWNNWTAPAEFVAAAPFASLDVDVARLAGALPTDQRFALPGPARFKVPLLLTFPDQGSILFETKETGRDHAIGALNNLVLRLLAGAPPGRAVFTILDPVDLGQSFAGLMHLADHEDRLINRRIWTQPEHIEQRLAELNEHIEKVTQLYLRNEYANIAEYNDQAGRIAEPYHFLVVADFPANFTDLAIRRLLSVIASGPRCGVFTLIHWDQRKSTTAVFLADDLRKASVCVRSGATRLVLGDAPLEGTAIALEPLPEPERATAFLEKVGRCSVDSNRVEMPFAEIAPEEDQLWTLETNAELRVPIGRTGATKFQHLALGKGTRQHVLVAGKTGSGKSTLFHVIITNLSLWCGPDRVEFYLVDFKKGVEFKCYAARRLPHARVVAIESDREFGLSVLERVDEELRRRGDLFRRLGVQDLAGYKRAAADQPLARTLLIIDEFQEFFVEDDRVSQNAALLLDRLVRQGRAFGIHVLLGSQTLGGAYTLARTTLGQMVVRIALQCNEADAMLIMDDDNPAPRLLSRPGEAIYNDSAGAIEGNSPFQVVWLSEAERESWLAKLRLRADRTPSFRSGPVVFEGNAPAEVRDNPLLQSLLQTDAIRPSTAARTWLGAPNSIKGPTEVTFHRQSANSVLIIGQRDESALAMLGVALVALAAQHPRARAQFLVLDVTAPNSRHREFLEGIVRAMPHKITLVGNAELGPAFAELTAEFDKRANTERAADSPAVYVFIHGIQRFKALRLEDEFGLSPDDTSTASPAQQLEKLICEGTPLGFHVVCACDTLNNANRFFSRKTLSEFELRVLFQMSANDSANLIDSAKAATLGLHRAILHNAQAGTIETFRPYALPDDAWINEVAKHLSRLLA